MTDILTLSAALFGLMLGPVIGNIGREKGVDPRARRLHARFTRRLRPGFSLAVNRSKGWFLGHHIGTSRVTFAEYT